MAARTGGRTARRGRDLPLVDLRRQLVADTSHSLVGVVWRWRTEVAGLLVGLLLFGLLVEHVGRAWAWWIVAGLLAVTLTVGPARRLAVGRFWCVVTRHRLFAVFSESRVFNRSGRFPLILRVARTPVGERAVVWCRPARSVLDLGPISCGVCGGDFAPEDG